MPRGKLSSHLVVEVRDDSPIVSKGDLPVEVTLRQGLKDEQESTT